MKTCPYCAESIQTDAIKCRYCHEFLEDAPSAPAHSSELPWLYQTQTLLIATVIGGPLVLPLIWRHPTMPRRTKWLFTVLTLALLLALASYAWVVLSNLWELWQDVDRIRHMTR